MSNLEDYNAELEAINAIPDEDVQVPNQPVDSFLQEGENLYHWSLDDAVQLNVVGITNPMIKNVPVRAGACREAQSIWNKDYHSQQEAQKEWKRLSPDAYEFRNDLLASMRFGFRKEPALLGRVSAIAEGDGHDDMIQDLNDLAVLGRENEALLTAIGIDLTELDRAASTADEMADLLARANGDKAELNDSKVIRDKAFMHLKALVDEIREAGKYVFRKNKSRYKGYTSSYWKKKKRTKDSAEEPAE